MLAPRLFLFLLIISCVDYYFLCCYPLHIIVIRCHNHVHLDNRSRATRYLLGSVTTTAVNHLLIAHLRAIYYLCLSASTGKMNACPCANYYNRPNPNRCTNYVSKFGERCKLCVTVKDGQSMTRGLLPEDELWMTATPGYNDHQNSSQGSKGGDKKSGGYISSWLRK
ncbi:hypothetical protein QBC36DRAFT_323785 [Triangularia setosa]|uniref:Uncharacterized protein n=1 Tax=Triangularia setosa TaxID=2587417 RepID=A0AAN7AA30_9PEZI|nr:hypothetical protein QBC36DRAFT_323785 [Podospora setosa]